VEAPDGDLQDLVKVGITGGQLLDFGNEFVGRHGFLAIAHRSFFGRPGLGGIVILSARPVPIL
jgi:hypothetical protein